MPAKSEYVQITPEEAARASEQGEQISQAWSVQAQFMNVDGLAVVNACAVITAHTFLQMDFEPQPNGDGRMIEFENWVNQVREHLLQKIHQQKLENCAGSA